MAMSKPRVALLHQVLDPPVVDGAKKPRKPGGYRDSCADIAFALSKSDKVSVVTQSLFPDPADQVGWSFGDDEDGIKAAVEAGATHLWANTVLFDSHPLQTSRFLDERAESLRVVAHAPSLFYVLDNKEYLNRLLREQAGLSLPSAWTVSKTQNVDQFLKSTDIPYPVVAKPIRGRGSTGVKLCETEKDLSQHINLIFEQSTTVMIEQFLAGEEGTITVMPPCEGHDNPWALPFVQRFDQAGGVMPYVGTTPASTNSRALSNAGTEQDPAYLDICLQCAGVGKLLGLTAPIRIDVRRFSESKGSPFALFDINLKPVSPSFSGTGNISTLMKPRT